VDGGDSQLTGVCVGCWVLPAFMGGPAMSIESQLREKLRKIEALFAGAGTAGERLAAEAALERVRARLAELGGQYGDGARAERLH
jgi:hypothetical protein